MMELARHLEEDLAWREAELASLKVLCGTAAGTSVRHSALLRALVTMLYAHYEGFCKYALALYVDALRRTGERLGALDEDLAVFALRRRLRLLKTQSHHDVWAFAAREVPRLLNAPAAFEEEYELGNNLWPKVLRQACQDTCLPFGELDDHEHRIAALVNRRNDIAHGQKHMIATIGEVHAYEEAAFAVMLHLACAIIDILEQRRFLRTGAPTSV